MMTKSERIETLSLLRQTIYSQPNFDEILEKAYFRNNFFIQEFSKKAIDEILSWHQKPVLENWLKLVEEPAQQKRVGLILAGNIPLVGWHDLLSVFANGHLAYFKTSQSDEILINWFIETLIQIDNRAESYFHKTERFNEIDALIATGSSATSANLDFYFKSVPRLLRGSKTSLGLIYGFENEEEMSPLADDLMLYFGLGCRNVTKLLVPEEYDFSPLFVALERYRFVTDHHKYINNCIYHKSIFLMNGDSFLESDITTIRPHKAIYSPVGVINYEVYDSLEHAKQIISDHKPDIQCIVSHQGQFEGSIPFGAAQKPEIDQYADGVNTLAFLADLNQDVVH